MSSLIESILNSIMSVINHLGYFGIAAGMFLESACIPLPSELVLPAAGFLVSDGKINIIGANIAVAIGSICGSLLAYYVGYYGGRPFILKYGKYFFVSENHFNKAENTFNKYGGAAVFFGRLLPVIRTFISLPAGIARMDIRKFLTYSLVGMIPWNFTLIFLGYKFRKNYDTVIHPLFKRFEDVVIVAILLIVVLIVVKIILGKRKKRNTTY